MRDGGGARQANSLGERNKSGSCVDLSERFKVFVMRGSGVQFPPAAPYKSSTSEQSARGPAGTNVPAGTVLGAVSAAPDAGVRPVLTVNPTVTRGRHWYAPSPALSEIKQ